MKHTKWEWVPYLILIVWLGYYAFSKFQRSNNDPLKNNLPRIIDVKNLENADTIDLEFENNQGRGLDTTLLIHGSKQ